MSRPRSTLVDPTSFNFILEKEQLAILGQEARRRGSKRVRRQADGIKMTFGTGVVSVGGLVREAVDAYIWANDLQAP